jgi:hypothetical protein
MNDPVDMDYYRPPHVLTCGCVQIRMPRQLELSQIFHAAHEPAAVSITFFGRAAQDGPLLLSIQMFRLPEGQREFDDTVRSFAQDRKKSARTPEGVRFDPSMLALDRLPKDCQHEAFCRSGRDFIHTYLASRYAMLIRYRGNSTMLDNPMFRQLNNNLSIVEEQWELAAPAWQPRKIKPTVQEEQLDPSICSEITQSIERGYAHLQLPSSETSPEAVQEAIMAMVDRVINSRKRPPADKIEDLAIDLGCLWGQALCDAIGWHWCKIRHADSASVFAVVSPEGSHAVAPMPFMLRQLRQRRRDADNTTLLLFNMIKDGALPIAPAKTYKMLS